MTKIGIYSGVFDPIHNGHLAFAKQTARQLDLDKVYFVLEAVPRRKTLVTSEVQRREMICLAIQNEPLLGLLETSHKTLSVTKTLPVIQQKFANSDLFILMGSDLFSFVDTWQDFADLQKAVTFVVGVRQQDIIRQDIDCIPMHADFSDVSSGVIRDNFTKFADNVPKNVANYIRQNRLYESSPPSK